MLKNPRVIGVKNSSHACQDIQMWKDEELHLSSPDEQFLSGWRQTIGSIPAALPSMRKAVSEDL